MYVVQGTLCRIVDLDQIIPRVWDSCVITHYIIILILVGGEGEMAWPAKHFFNPRCNVVFLSVDY